MIYCMQFDVLSSNNAQLSKKTTVTDRGVKSYVEAMSPGWPGLLFSADMPTQQDYGTT